MSAAIPTPTAVRTDGAEPRAAKAPKAPRRPVYTVVGIIILAFMLFPLYWMINVSLQPAGNAVATPWLPFDLTLRGYTTAIDQQGRNLVTSLLISLGSVVFSLLIATPAAYAMAHFKFGRWATAILFGILITQMVPGIVVANALYSAYTDLGLLNTLGGLILADSAAGIPFSIILMRAFMGSIPTSIIEAAYVDGAGHVRAFFSIVLPMSRNALITSGLFTFLFAWGDFLFALTLTTTADLRPITLGLYTYVGSFVSDWSPIMATAVLSSLPAIALLVLAQRYVAAGVTGGAVKS
ncbi:carbohydrate ABC transporter permease [Kineococcus rubinsiae]|uniref:carbohydrate ABC transporter permease n=1 Tax=Kineococcus rubinsiae TaxID=2609562 RepID=UPI0014312273|nr:carbohydrate ABC transporter permease [Kineococcus rubinsiae]NIZ93125.1 carbohydrate ABC transporter permease [Kineococcus rubinsiae]